METQVLRTPEIEIATPCKGSVTRSAARQDETTYRIVMSGGASCDVQVVRRGAQSSARELFELADVEDFAHLLEMRRRIAGPEIGKDRGALIDIVGGRDARKLRRLHSMINLGPFLVV